MMHFWINFGISGFRMDVINMIGKDLDFPPVDDPFHLDYLTNQGPVHDYLHEMYQEVFKGRDLLTVGETPFATPDDALLYTGFEREELNMLFHFDVMLGLPLWNLETFRHIQNQWASRLHNQGWIAQYFNNHDQARSVSRYGHDGQWRIESAKALATLTHLHPGTPYIYQGEEIGMTNCDFESIEDYHDIFFNEFV
jgi:oligo-1,6-glucosidase